VAFSQILGYGLQFTTRARSPVDLLSHINPLVSASIGGRSPFLGKTSKSKVIPVTGRGGLYDCEMLSIPHCVDNRLTDGDNVASLRDLCHTRIWSHIEAHIWKTLHPYWYQKYYEMNNKNSHVFEAMKSFSWKYGKEIYNLLWNRINFQFPWLCLSDKYVLRCGIPFSAVVRKISVPRFSDQPRDCQRCRVYRGHTSLAYSSVVV
jgi:hypothetical protein